MLLIGKELTFTKQSLILTTLGKKPDENIVGKRENAVYQHAVFFFQVIIKQRKSNVHSYFLAGRTMPWYAVSIVFKVFPVDKFNGPSV